MSSMITIKDSLINLTAQGASVKASSLNLTAAIIMACIAYGDDSIEQARAAIRSNLIANGFVKMDKGTKQPSDKVRGFLNAGGAALTLHGDKVRSILAAASSIEEQTTNLAAWLATFALSGNYYEGGVFLYALVKGLSKKAAKDKLKVQAEADNQPEGEEESNVTKGKPKAQGVPATPDKAKPLSAVMVINGVIPSLLAAVAVKKGSKPSLEVTQAAVRLANDLSNMAALVRGDTGIETTKEVKRLAVAIAGLVKNLKKEARNAPRLSKGEKAKALRRADKKAKARQAEIAVKQAA